MTPLPLVGYDLYRFFHAGDSETLALRGVSVAIGAGELVAVVGPSGSGKSTLLSCLAGLDDPDGGSVQIHGELLSRRPEKVRAQLRNQYLGVIYQQWNLLSHLTVAQNLALVQQLAVRRRLAAALPDPGELLADLGIGRQADAYPMTLSGGEAARAALAVAVATGPVVLLADEPTGELDRDTEAAVLDLLAGRARAGVAVLVASHSPAVAQRADRVLRMRDGVLAS